ncbi:MAG TPA: LysR family transcriptional regulator [Micrococcaceae bacterium]
MELRWLEAFISVAEELHFGRAAERLHMAQSPLSQTIRKLEKELGIALFERNTRSVSLTAAGNALLPHARSALAEVDLGRRASRSAIGGAYGNVVIGFSGALNHLTLPPLARAVRTRFPDVTLALVDRVMTTEAVQQLQHGTLDLAFVGLPLDSPAVRTRRISREELGLAVRSDHPLAGAPAVRLAEVAGEDFISLPLASGSSLRETMVSACLEAGFRPRIVQEVIDPYTVLSLVAAGVGVSLVPACLAGIMPSGSAYVPLAGRPAMLDAGLAWLGSNTSGALGAVLGLAADVLPTPVPD